MVKSFEELFAEIKARDELIREKIENQFRHPNFHRQVHLEKEIYDILLNENQEEIIKEKFLRYLTGRILKNSSVNQEDDLLTH